MNAKKTVLVVGMNILISSIPLVKIMYRKPQESRDSARINRKLNFVFPFLFTFWTYDNGKSMVISVPLAPARGSFRGMRF
jgi:hypothetical protein